MVKLRHVKKLTDPLPLDYRPPKLLVVEEDVPDDLSTTANDGFGDDLGEERQRISDVEAAEDERVPKNTHFEFVNGKGVTVMRKTLEEIRSATKLFKLGAAFYRRLLKPELWAAHI